MASTHATIARHVFRLSIPVKVVLLTGMVYLVTWSLGTIATITGLVDFSATILGIKAVYLWWTFQILCAAAAATADRRNSSSV